MNSLLSPQVEKFITKSTKWTNWDYWSPQVEKFITKSTKWMNWDYLSPQVDEFFIKSTSGEVYYKVDKLRLFKSTSGRVHH